MDWVGTWVPPLTLLLAAATLLWTRLPDYSPLRLAERLAALRKDLTPGSEAANLLDAEIDARVRKLLEPRVQRRARRVELATVLTVFAGAMAAGVATLALSVWIFDLRL